MRALHFENKWVLITGASSGLGYEMALQMAKVHRANLILVARREDKLRQLKQQIEEQGHVAVKTIAADLSDINDIDRTVSIALEDNNLYGVILNAGITYFGKHLDMDWAQFNQLLQTNVAGTVRMCQQFSAYFEENNREGGLLVVSSMAAILPTPYQAAYSGTKGFMLNFIRALSQELKSKKFSMTVFLPGGMATEMTDNEKFAPLKRWLMPVSQAATIGLEAFRKRKNVCVPGLSNRFGVYISAFVPKKIIIRTLGKTYAKALMISQK